MKLLTPKTRIPMGTIYLVPASRRRLTPVERDSLYVANYLLGYHRTRSANKALQCLTRVSVAALKGKRS